MTYHLWHSGTDTGPFTRTVIEDRHKRGELVGILWRRSGDTQYRPFEDLAAELETITPEHLVGSEPSGKSKLGMVAGGLGGLSAAVGIPCLLISPIFGAALIGAGLGLLGIGTLFDIHAKLALIAHRLQRW